MSKYYMYNGRFYSDEELMHWKYIKREKKNGRWVYYYDDSEEKRAKAAYDHATRGLSTAKSKYYSAEDDKNRAELTYKLGLAAGKGLSANGNKKVIKATRELDNKNREVYEKAQSKYDKAEKTFKDAKAIHEKVEKEYEKVLNKDIKKKTIAKGAVKVANILSNMFRKKKK